MRFSRRLLAIGLIVAAGCDGDLFLFDDPVGPPELPVVPVNPAPDTTRPSFGFRSWSADSIRTDRLGDDVIEISGYGKFGTERVVVSLRIVDANRIVFHSLAKDGNGSELKVLFPDRGPEWSWSTWHYTGEEGGRVIIAAVSSTRIAGDFSGSPASGYGEGTSMFGGRFNVPF